MGWRLTNVPMRCFRRRHPDSALRWPRSFASRKAEMLPRAYRDRTVRPFRRQRWWTQIWTQTARYEPKRAGMRPHADLAQPIDNYHALAQGDMERHARRRISRPVPSVGLSGGPVWWFSGQPYRSLLGHGVLSRGRSRPSQNGCGPRNADRRLSPRRMGISGRSRGASGASRSLGSSSRNQRGCRR